MLDALLAYLESLGYDNITIDFEPAVSEIPDYIGLFCWEKLSAAIYDQTAEHMLQLRVRRPGHQAQEAESLCLTIAELLDSGDNETPIPLTHPGAVIGRIRRLPRVLDRKDDTVTYYAELALWGQVRKE